MTFENLMTHQPKGKRKIIRLEKISLSAATRYIFYIEKMKIPTGSEIRKYFNSKDELKNVLGALDQNF